MNINRHNYETFFLLYVDRELSAAEVKAVDMFVAANPDLEEELLMLKQTVLAPEAVTTDIRSSLLKQEGATLQEKLLLLIDDELSAAEKDNLQLQLQKDATVAAEWNILQQTKLSADAAIVFPDKRSLYRKEPAKVVGIRWWRVVAAAVVIGLGIWGATGIYNRQYAQATDGNELAGGKKPVQKNIIVPVIKDNAPANTSVNTVIPQADDVQNTAAIRTPKQNNTLPVAQKTNTAQQVKAIKDATQDEKENTAVVTGLKKETNNLPTPLENFNSIQRNKNNPPYVSPVESSNAKEPQDMAALTKSGTTEKLKGITLTEPANPDAKAAVYKEGDDNAVAMQAGQTKHSKFGGFLRKVKRVIERTTNIKTGDDDVIKIAGFDIAIK